MEGASSGEIGFLEEERDKLKSPATKDDKEWTVKLDRYERDNLLALLNAIGYPYPKAQRIEALAPLNNGDWVGQIALKLKRRDGSYVIDEQDHPSVPLRHLKQRIDGE